MNNETVVTDIAKAVFDNEAKAWNVEVVIEEHTVTFAMENHDAALVLVGLINECAWAEVRS